MANIGTDVHAYSYRVPLSIGRCVHRHMPFRRARLRLGTVRRTAHVAGTWGVLCARCRSDSERACDPDEIMVGAHRRTALVLRRTVACGGRRKGGPRVSTGGGDDKAEVRWGPSRMWGCCGGIQRRGLRGAYAVGPTRGGVDGRALGQIARAGCDGGGRVRVTTSGRGTVSIFFSSFPFSGGGGWRYNLPKYV